MNDIENGSSIPTPRASYITTTEYPVVIFLSFITLVDKTLSSEYPFLTRYVQILNHIVVNCINKVSINILSGYFSALYLQYYWSIENYQIISTMCLACFYT